MSAKEETNLTFEDFLELCQEAGITTDNVGVLEQDFRAGKALADVTDALITDYETHTSAYTQKEAIDAMDIAMTLMAEAEKPIASRSQAVKMAVMAVRYLAEHCHDEGKN